MAISDIQNLPIQDLDVLIWWWIVENRTCHPVMKGWRFQRRVHVTRLDGV